MPDVENTSGPLPDPTVPGTPDSRALSFLSAIALKKAWRTFLTLVKIALAMLVAVELAGFLAVTATNLLLYGSVREGSGAVYDPYTLFLVSDNPMLPGEDGRSPLVHASVNPTQSSEKRTIWLFGGSTLRGFTAWKEKTIASFVADSLNSGAAERNVTVVNFGVPSFNSLMETKYLQKALIERGDLPDLIIFYDGANDAKYAAECRSPYGHHGYRKTKALIESYSKSSFGLFTPLNAAYYASYTKQLLDRINQVQVPMARDSPLVREIMNVTTRRYDYVSRIAQAYGADFLLVWQPMFWVEDCEVPAEVRQKESRLAGAADRFTAVRNNFTVPYVAILDALKDKPYFVNFRSALCDRTDPVYKPDGVHLTDAGNRAVALKLSTLLERRFFDSSLVARGPGDRTRNSVIE